MKALIATAIIALAATGCATSPEHIAPVANSGSCTDADRARLEEIKQEQSSTAGMDKFSVFLIGVPAGSFVREDHEAEIAILKGRCR